MKHRCNIHVLLQSINVHLANPTIVSKGYTTYEAAGGAYGVSPSGPAATGAAYLPFDHPSAPGPHEQQTAYQGQGYGSTGHGGAGNY